MTTETFFVCYRNDDHLLLYLCEHKASQAQGIDLIFSPYFSSNENLLSFWLLDFSHENWSCRVFMDSDKNLKLLLLLISHDRQTSMKKEGKGKKRVPQCQKCQLCRLIKWWLGFDYSLKKISRGLLTESMQWLIKELVYMVIWNFHVVYLELLDSICSK